MKTKFINILAATAVMLGASSCSENWFPPTEDEGELSLSSLLVTNNDAEKLIHNEQSRAGVDVSGYEVLIYRSGDTEPYKQWTYSAMPEIITLPQGDYTVDVRSHEVQKSEWEKPYFFGTKDFSITAGKITNIGEVTCYFSSIKVSVVFADDLKAVMGDDVKVTVIANDLGQLEYTASETRKGYFEALEGSNTIAVKFEGSIKGIKTEAHKIFDDAEAGQHRIFEFKTKNAPVPDPITGNIDAGGITIDFDVINEDIDGNITVEEDVLDSSDRPGDEDPKDPVDPDKPENPDVPDNPDKVIDYKVSDDSKNLKLEEINYLTDGVPFGAAVVNIFAEKKFANLNVNIVTDNSNFKLAIETFFPLTFDLANPGDNAEGLGSLGLPVGDEVLGQDNVKFDITQFMDLLAGFKGTHEFNVNIVDQEGNEDGFKLTFVVN